MCFTTGIRRYASVEDLGSPDAAAARLLDKYLNKEFMSTRIGIKREGEIISAASRQGDDGRLYYDLEVGCRACRKEQLGLQEKA